MLLSFFLTFLNFFLLIPFLYKRKYSSSLFIAAFQLFVTVTIIVDVVVAVLIVVAKRYEPSQLICTSVVTRLYKDTEFQSMLMKTRVKSQISPRMLRAVIWSVSVAVNSDAQRKGRVRSNGRVKGEPEGRESMVGRESKVGS